MPEYSNRLYDVYPRGFVGALNGHEGSKQAQPNMAVQALYEEYLRSNRIGYDFDFREKILKVALQAFGCYCFQQWIEAQYCTRGLTDMHQRFLQDTLQFIRYGKRSMNLESWQALVLFNANAPALRTLPDDVREFFRIGEKYRPDTTLPAVIQRWCEKPNGLEDLLGTLHILFGALVTR